jgi:opacity protein-like surface antigen
MQHNVTVLAASVMVLAGMLAPEARADGHPRFEITPFVGYRAGGGFNIEDAEGNKLGSVDVGDDASYGLDLGLYRDDNSFYEFLYSRQPASLDSNDPLLNGIDVTVEYYQLGGTAMFPDESDRFLPYLSMTIGATRLSASGYDSDTKFSASLGGGLRIPFTENLIATLGLRGYLTFMESNTQFLCISDNGNGTCLLKSSGSTFFQGEAQLGLAFRF